jgi:SAM-dependent methyltransferase
MTRDTLERLRAAYDRRQTPSVAGRYDPRRPGEAYGLERRRDACLTLLRRHCPGGLGGLSVLDVGCGRGQRLAEWADWGADRARLVGVDVLEPFVRAAAASFPTSGWLVASGDALPFADGAFDLVGQAMAVSSVLDDAMRRRMAAEMWRVTRPGGLVLWYDMRFANPWNPDMRPVGAAELAALFPVPPLESRSLTLLPPLARRLAPLSMALCRLLERLPPLRSHRLVLYRKDMP